MAVFIPTASKQFREPAARKNHEAKACRLRGLEHETRQLAGEDKIRLWFSLSTLGLTCSACSA
jgi:hypothetical protein